MPGFFAMLIPVEIVYIAIICLLAWFWLNSMQARDTAVMLGRQAAERYGLQLLDETVEIRRLWAARDTNGRLRFVRTYAFEVSDTGTHRLSCTLTLLGGQLEQLDIPPHRETIH